jgi:preprotein translocase subunit SecG
MPRAHDRPAVCCARRDRDRAGRVVLLQKSEGGALGMGGGGMSGFMTGRSTANLLTRTTAVLAALFFLTSIFLVMLSNAGGRRVHVDEAPPGPVAPIAPSPQRRRSQSRRRRRCCRLNEPPLAR